MEWNVVLLWMVPIACAVNLIAALRASPRLWGYAGVAVAVAAVTAVLYLRRPDVAGLAGGGLLFALLVAPALLQRPTTRWSVRQRYDLARWPATAAGVLHPFDGLRQQARLLRALALGDRGDTAAAEATLTALLAGPTRIARPARLHLARLSNRWDPWLEWAESNLGFAKLCRDPSLTAGFVRALGEAGRLSDMVEAAASQRVPHHPATVVHRALTRLPAFAFAGQPDRVADLIAGPLAALPPATAAFWTATAEMAAGDPAAGQARLLAAAATASPGTRAAIDYRRGHPPAVATEVLTPVDLLMLDQMHRDAGHEQLYLAAGPRPWVTYALVAANVAMFAAEGVVGHGDTMDDVTLVRLGALLPDVYQTHEYQRLCLANFLHAGSAHIVMNMFALLVLGPFVERSLGRPLYLAVYLGSGTAALAVVVVLQQHRLAIEGPLVGASAAIMALVGATAGVLLRGWRRDRAAAAARRLRGVLVILIFQVAFDYFTPQVSGAAHLAGAAFGFAFACLLPHRPPTRQPRGSPALRA